MPRKRISNLSKNSSRARAAKVARNHESSFDAELRRQQQAQRQSVLRAAETPLRWRVQSERNSCFQMTSFGVDKVIRMPGISPTFTVQGQIYHQIGSLFPEGNDQHKFLHVYFMGDEQNEVNRRFQYIEGVERETVLKIQRILQSQCFGEDI
ncbi:unnamed protein product [Psylliodes chrysocephalus]|uniref:Uncharacterized protein n=1 Tax=Psylliodes chrysocephalus TaxID=3402493 RepID=A0A9P0GKX7_9CUCU|nr:unnamed protein product [Psylliodes chrysocephala]